MTRKKYVTWDGNLQNEAVDVLKAGGNMVVCPTKVGYIITACDKIGLERKFVSKNRKRHKPGVVLCSSLEQLHELAEMNQEIAALYKKCWKEDILLGCILPWKKSGMKSIPEDGSKELMMDVRGTSCFVIKFGLPAEQIAESLWNQDRTLLFASSANPSGKGNRGVVAGIGARIEEETDLIVAGDAYVKSIQPDKTAETRYEQGVMVSFVDKDGKLVPEQGQQRSVKPAPVVIRKGLDIERILLHLSDSCQSWDYRHGDYY